MRVGYLCMQSEFSVAPLEALLEAGHDVRFVMRPFSRERRREAVLERQRRRTERARAAELSRTEPFLIAERAGIPRFLVGDASSAPALSLYRKERVDVLVVAFFNQLLRPEAFENLPYGAVNAHPSLLPEYRGPAPLFWTFYEARSRTGVTVHRVTRGEDDGAVFTRAPLEIPFGARGEWLMPQLASAAGNGIVDALERLARGGDDTEEQDHARATRAPRPTAREQRLDPTWEARRLFTFVRGVGRWNRLVVQVGDAAFRAVDAEELDEHRRPPGDWALLGDQLVLTCREGSVTLRVRELSQG